MAREFAEIVSDHRDAFQRLALMHCDDVAQLCESPAEQAMYWALLGALDNIHTCPQFNPPLGPWYGDNALGFSLAAEQSPSCVRAEYGGGYFDTWVAPQAGVEADGIQYRLDFAVCFVPDRSSTARPLRVDLEVDGHDFHERTKEQAAHDRDRDRRLQAAGWLIARFTGSQVYKNASGCADELLRMVNAVWAGGRR